MTSVYEIYFELGYLGLFGSGSLDTLGKRPGMKWSSSDSYTNTELISRLIR